MKVDPLDFVYISTIYILKAYRNKLFTEYIFHYLELFISRSTIYIYT